MQAPDWNPASILMNAAGKSYHGAASGQIEAAG
jgi:hypothetical protein